MYDGNHDIAIEWCTIGRFFHVEGKVWWKLRPEFTRKRVAAHVYFYGFIDEFEMDRILKIRKIIHGFRSIEKDNSGVSTAFLKTRLYDLGVEDYAWD